MLFHSYDISSLCRPHALSAIRDTVCLVKEDCPILTGSWSYIAFIAFLKDTIFQAALDTTTIFCPFLLREGSGGLDVTGFAGRHTSRRSCFRLQFFTFGKGDNNNDTGAKV
jgi:hypothetical protein